MGRNSGTSHQDERGAAAVEFGLISVVLLTLLIGIVQASLWLWAYEVGAHSAREGARVGAVDPCDIATIEQRVRDRADSASASTPAVTVSHPDGSPVKVGDQVTVDVTYTPNSVGGFFSFPTIEKTATARIENVPGGGC